MRLSIIISRIHSIEVGKDGRYGFKISRKHRRLAFVFSLLVRLIWFCDTAKLSKSVLSNFKNYTHFPAIQTFQNKKNLHRQQPWWGLPSPLMSQLLENSEALYRVSLSSSWSHEKPFQSAELDAYNILTSICNGFPKYSLLDQPSKPVKKKA